MLSAIWKALLASWAFVADTAQILGVDWKQVLGLVVGTGASTWAIGFVTGVGAFQLAVGVTAVMFFVAGASAFSRYRKLPIAAAPEDLPGPSKKSTDLAEIDREIQRSKPRFAAPKGKEDFPIGSITFAELGN
jgi:hypothetical protein